MNHSLLVSRAENFSSLGEGWVGGLLCSLQKSHQAQICMRTLFFSMSILACIPQRKRSSLEPNITALAHVTDIKINSVYLCLLMRLVWLGQRRSYTAWIKCKGKAEQCAIVYTDRAAKRSPLWGADLYWAESQSYSNTWIWIRGGLLSQTSFPALPFFTLCPKNAIQNKGKGPLPGNLLPYLEVSFSYGC